MSQTPFIPPQNIEAEKAVVGGILIEERSIHDLPADLKPDAFYIPTHGHVFEAMLALWQREAPIDSISVLDETKRSGHDIEISTLTNLFEWGMPQSIRYHANLVIEASRQRQAINLVREALTDLQNNPDHHSEIMGRLYTANETATASKSVHIGAVMVESLKRIENAHDAASIIPTGFCDLDRQIGGFERGDLVVPAGRPSMGKTSLALDFIINAAARGYSVLFVSVETSREKLGMRMLSRETKMNSRKFRTGNLDDGDYSRLAAASGKLSRLAVDVLDRESDWENIKREIRRHRGLDVVVLDYLTLLDLPTGRNERRDLAVGRVANEAKRLALSMNLVFILLSQLNRKSEDRNDPEPIMSDLRDSGDIEQAADVIIFPFRPVIYDVDYRPRDKAFLKIAKARDLPTGKIPVRFNAEITSFSDWTD
jgi:replicative DNA helicase